MWHGLIVDSWREILRGKKKALSLSNLKISERADLCEGSVARLFTDHSDPPISHIISVASVLEVPLDELFAPSLPGGMRSKALIEEFGRITQENAALREENANLRAKVDALKDELLDVYRKK